jgi:hypothetical protein
MKYLESISGVYNLKELRLYAPDCTNRLQKRDFAGLLWALNAKKKGCPLDVLEIAITPGMCFDMFFSRQGVREVEADVVCRRDEWVDNSVRYTCVWKE